MDKLFWRSKNFWTGVAGVATSIGMLSSGELTIQTFIIDALPGVLGILSIIFRWSADKPLGVKK
mgnify:CR=1